MIVVIFNLVQLNWFLWSYASLTPAESGLNLLHDNTKIIYFIKWSGNLSFWLVAGQVVLAALGWSCVIQLFFIKLPLKGLPAWLLTKEILAWINSGLYYPRSSEN